MDSNASGYHRASHTGNHPETDWQKTTPSRYAHTTI